MTAWITSNEDYIKYCIWHWVHRKDAKLMLKLQKELIEITLAEWWTYKIHWLLSIAMNRIKLRKDLWDYALSPKAKLSIRFRHNNIKYDKHWTSSK